MHVEFFEEYVPLLKKNHNLDTLLPRFRNYVTNNIDEICVELNTTQLLSICDIFIRHGDDTEVNISFNITFMVNYERLTKTYYHNYTKLDKKSEGRHELWDGLYTYDLENKHDRDDFHDIFKMMNVMCSKVNYFHLLKIYRTIINRMKESDTVIGNLCEI